MFLRLKIKNNTYYEIETKTIKNIQDLINLEKKTKINIPNAIEKQIQKETTIVSFMGIICSIIIIDSLINVSLKYKFLLLPEIFLISFSIVNYILGTKKDKKEIERIKKIKNKENK